MVPLNRGQGIDAKADAAHSGKPMESAGLNRVDVVIVNYNSTDTLLACLGSMKNVIREISIRIFVLDNHSRDDVDRVKILYPEIILIKNPYNIGFGKAVNIGIKNGDAPYVVLLNPDTLLLEGFFQTAIQYLDEHPDVGVLGPKILDPDGSVQGSARSFPTPLTAFFGRNSLLTKLFPNNSITRQNLLTLGSDGSSPMEVDWVSGACLFARRKALEDVGFMDERFFMYWEDADLCRRIWKSGWKVVYFPRSGLIHHVGVSSGQEVFRAMCEFHKSSYLLFEKYTPGSLSVIKPLVLAGVFFRLNFLIAGYAISRMYKKAPSFSKKRREAAGFAQKTETISVLRIIARLNIGGPSIHVYLLSKGLDPRKFNSTLVTGRISPNEGDMKYLFDSLNHRLIYVSELQREINLKLDLKAFWRISKILCREKPEIVHTHTAKAGTSARIAVFLHNFIFRTKIRTIHTFHGHVFKGYFNRFKVFVFIIIERILSTMTDIIIAISETQKMELTEEFRIAPADKIKTIQLGFELDPYLENNGLKNRFRRQLGLNSDTLLIGIVGRLAPIKNHMMFLKAARIFIEENPDLRVRFVVVGDGELRRILEAFCRDAGIDKYVHFCGWIKQIALVYHDLDILALTSLNEGTPVSIIEAMASSVPVVATDAGGVVDLLGPAKGRSPAEGLSICERGILCRKTDIHGFSKGLEYLIQMNAHDKKAMLDMARDFVKREYTHNRLVKDIETLYLGLVTQ